jgi:hypothetical protein
MRLDGGQALRILALASRSCQAAGRGAPMYLYIIVIGWLYVVVLMAATEKTLVAAVLTFLGYGLVPCAVVVGALGLTLRGRRSGMSVGDEVHQPHRADPQGDE